MRMIFESTLMEFNITEKSDRNLDITTQVSGIRFSRELGKMDSYHQRKR
jgi:hypothetical protein